jgi:hypothetical protein
MPSLPDSSSFIGQEFQVLYLSLGQNLMTEVQSINVMRTDGGADVETLARDWAGRVKGAAKAVISAKGVIPYAPPDTGGVGFASGGMVAGAAPGAGATQMDLTMLTSLNGYSNQPVQFTIAIGNPAVQQLVFKGFISEFTVDSAVGKQADFSFKASGQFSTFSSI